MKIHKHFNNKNYMLIGREIFHYLASKKKTIYYFFKKYSIIKKFIYLSYLSELEYKNHSVAVGNIKDFEFNKWVSFLSYTTHSP